MKDKNKEAEHNEWLKRMTDIRAVDGMCPPPPIGQFSNKGLIELCRNTPRPTPTDKEQP